MARLATAVEGFDAMIQGGLPAGSSVVLQGPPGQEKLRFALTFLAEGLRAGASGLVVVSSQSPDAVLAQLRDFGVDVDAVTRENRLRIVDWYSWSEEPVQDIEDRGLVVRSSIDLTNLGVALSRAIAGVVVGEQPPRAVMDILSPAMNVYEVTQVYAFAQSAKKKFDRYRFTSLVLLEKEMHSSPDLTTLHQPFDGVIEIERSRAGDQIVRKIGVLHLKDTAPDPSFRILEVTDSGLKIVRETSAPPSPIAAVRGTFLESQQDRARRLNLIAQIASERLKMNSRDPDALFALAAAQATLDDAERAVKTLERLADLNPNYPGLWVLKTKLHARLGQADLARQSRLRDQQTEPSEATAVGPTVPCPMCEAPLSVDATSCTNCGVKFATTRPLEDELDELGHAAIQDMVLEELGEEEKPHRKLLKRPLETQAGPPLALLPKPAIRPTPKGGLTNGLVLKRTAGPRAGITNGLKGRTNGLRGRTNGLTAGLGHTNGLTNGLGRTNGLTNGLGRTNGLTNGLGRTNGLTNGLGRTNGLPSGLRRVLPAGLRVSGVRGMMQNAGWKLYLIPMVTAALLLMPLFFIPEYNGPAYPVHIDGQFSDWASVSTEAMGSGGVLNPNVDIVRFGVVDNLGPFAFYVEVAGTALAGGGPSPGTMDTVRIFVDSDGSAATGYRIDGFGADRMIDISGYGGAVLSSTVWEFDTNRDQRDWNGWFKGTSTPAAASGSQIEAQAEWLTGTTSTPVIASVHAASWDGQSDKGDFPVSPSAGTLSVTADPQVPDILSGDGVSLLRLTLTAHGQPVSIDSLQLRIVGTAAPASALSLRLVNNATVLDQTVPTSRDVTFSLPSIQIAVGGVTTLNVLGDFASTSGETFGLRLPSTHPFGLGSDVVALRESPGARTLGYLGVIPATPRVDGGFDEWTGLTWDPSNDVASRANPNIDLTRYGGQHSGGSTFFYTDVAGRLMQGTPVPEAPRPAPSETTPSPPDTDRDTVPDSVDPMPYDFNNDGIPDAQTKGDYDGDGIVDYGLPGGTDDWLNTTLPSSFSPPYAGRSVSLYIGPTEKPPVLGEDALRIFFDTDNSTWSGYSIEDIGADRLVEIRGKDNEVTQSALLAFSGSFPGQWAWTPVSPVTVALGYHAVELSVPLNATNLYVEAGDFWGDVDTTTAVPARAPMVSSFKVAGAVQQLSVPWAQVGPQPTAALIDPGSNSATTTYNQQRKVVRAGPVTGQTACDATNSTGCWYVVFYDQLIDSEGPETWYAGNTNHASITACNGFNRVLSTTWGGGWSLGSTIDQLYCWYSDPRTKTYDSGSWSAILNLWRGTGSPPDPSARVTIDIVSTAGSVLSTILDETRVVTSTDTLNTETFTVSVAAQTFSDQLIRLRLTKTAGARALNFGSFAGAESRITTPGAGGVWDRIVLTRSLDTSGSTWGAQVILASGRASDNPLLYGYDSAEPSIAIDSAGRLHVVWVSAASVGDQSTLNRVRYTSTTVAYPSQSEIASASNWMAVAAVDDASPGHMPTISTDTADNPHIAWSQWNDAQQEAEMGYRSNTGTNTVNSPKTRTWDGTSWSLSETEQPTAGSPLRNVRMAYSPTNRTDRILVTVSDDGWLDAYVCTPTCTVTNNIGQVWSGAHSGTDYYFDIAYEQLSGTALLVYGVLSTDTTRDIAYREYTGSWGPVQYLDNTNNNTDLQYAVMNLAPRSGSDQIGLMAGTSTNTLMNAWIWSGTSFGSLTEITTTGFEFSVRDKAAIAWETNSGHLLAVTVVSGGGSLVYKEFTTSWSSPSTFTCSVSGKYIQFLRLKPNPVPTANDMILMVLDSGTSVNTCYWNGSGWSNFVTHDTAGDTWTARSADFAWESMGGEGLLVWGTTAGQITYRTYAAPNTWGSITDVTMGANGHYWVTLSTNPFPQTGGTKVLGTVLEFSANDLGAIQWDGSTFTVIGAAAFTADTGTYNYESFALEYLPVPGGYVYYKNRAGGTWTATVAWGATYAGLSVDVSPQNNYVSLARYDAGSHAIQYLVCKNLSPPTILCDASGQFTKWDGTGGFDTVASTSTATTVQSITPTSFSTPSTTHNVQMPAVVDAGDLLITFFAMNGTPEQFVPSGWTNFFWWNSWQGTGNRFSMFAKKATGTEGGTTVDFQTDTAKKAAAQVYRITGWRDSGTLANDIQYVNTGGTSTTPNPPSLNPTTWDVENALWIAAYGAEGDNDATTYPTNYVDDIYTESDNSATSTSMGSAWRTLTAASEDPGTFTMAGSAFWIASTVAVRPTVLLPNDPTYPSVATTYETNGNLWVAYAKYVNATTTAIFARFLDYAGGGWAPAETVDLASGKVFARPSIGIDVNNNVHALYVDASGPQLYYKARTGGSWGAATPVDAVSDNPTLVVRAPNNPAYGTGLGGLYWKTTTTETYFYYIPEFESVALPILGVLLVFLWTRNRRAKQGVRRRDT